MHDFVIHFQRIFPYKLTIFFRFYFWQFSRSITWDICWWEKGSTAEREAFTFRRHCSCCWTNWQGSNSSSTSLLFLYVFFFFFFLKNSYLCLTYLHFSSDYLFIYFSLAYNDQIDHSHNLWFFLGVIYWIAEWLTLLVLSLIYVYVIQMENTVF